MDRLPVEVLQNIFRLSLSLSREDRVSDEQHNESDEDNEPDEAMQSDEDMQSGEEDPSDEDMLSDEDMPSDEDMLSAEDMPSDKDIQPDKDGEGKPSQLSPYFTVPLTISHVCRYWRQVAISFGTLWTRLEIPCDRPRIKYDMIYTWLERTNGLPLDFSVQYKENDGTDDERRTLESVTKLLLAEQHRWRHVHFSWHFKAFSPGFTRVDMTNMPMLLSISVDIIIRERDRIELFLPNVSFARSRLVEKIDFGNACAIDYGTEPLRYLTCGIQYFCIFDERDVKTADTCLDALRACPNLETFHAEHLGDLDEDDHLRMSEKRPHLVHGIKQLILDDREGTWPELVISKVTLPNLRALKFKTTSFLDTETVLPGFFQRSKPPLQALELYGECAQHVNLIPTLRHLPSLRTLIIECCQDPELVFEGLSSIVDDDIICPNLLCMHLKEYGNPDDVPDPRRALDALCSMVESRKKPAAPGKIKVNDDFVIPTTHMRREFEVLLELVSMTREGYNNLYIAFAIDKLDEL